MCKLHCEPFRFRNKLLNAGLPVVASAHNFGTDVSGWSPVTVPDVITTGGINACDLQYYLGVTLDDTNATQIATGNGAGIDILAPAQGLRVARASVKGGGYRIHSGNSFSCPFTAGVIACMLQGNARLTTRTQVQSLNAKLLANATTGKFRSAGLTVTLPDKILYLDPNIAVEAI
jgi:subtilisin family serine protease